MLLCSGVLFDGAQYWPLPSDFTHVTCRDRVCRATVFYVEHDAYECAMTHSCGRLTV